MTNEERIKIAEQFAKEMYDSLKEWDDEQVTGEADVKSLLKTIVHVVMPNIENRPPKEAKDLVNEMFYRLKRKMPASHYEVLDNLYNGIIKACLDAHQERSKDNTRFVEQLKKEMHNSLNT